MPAGRMKSASAGSHLSLAGEASRLCLRSSGDASKRLRYSRLDVLRSLLADLDRLCQIQAEMDIIATCASGPH